MDKQEVLELVKELEVFKEVPEIQLQWMVDQSICRPFSQGEFLFKPNEAIDHMNLVVSGTFRIYFIQANSQRELGRIKRGDITGLLPFSRLKEAKGYGEAIEDSYVVSLPRPCLRDMITQHYELTEALVHFMTSRVRTFTKQQQQDEKLVSLGKLSAGLTHELNNPASAIVRSAVALKSHLQAVPENFKKVIKIRASDEDIDRANGLIFSKINNYKGNRLSLTEKTDLEDEIAEWLEDQGMEDGYEISENLVEFGFSIDDLEVFADIFSEEDLLPVINWIESNLTTEKMVSEIEEASSRIAGIIKSVKSYTHMDKVNDLQPVDVHEGIRSTITMLQHKVKKGGVNIQESFADSNPTFNGNPGKINQIWTNIIDNALDAMVDTKGAKLSIDTMEDGEFVRINIADNGSGIPQEIMDKIFDPFFTTKTIGQGTGIGLDVVNQIVNEHRGDIKVASKPGETIFKLCFPKDIQ